MVWMIDDFDPRLIPGIEAWYRADSLGNRADGSLLSRWLDESGNQRHLTQATGSGKPLFAKDAVNGYNAVEFDGSARHFLDTTAAPAIAFAIAVFKSDDATFVSTPSVVSQASPTAPTTMGITGKNALTTIYSYDGATVDNASGDDLSPTTDWHIVTVEDTTTPAAWSNGIAIGRYGTGGAVWDGHIAEVILYSEVPSAANKAVLQSYLNDKYEIY